MKKRTKKRWSKEEDTKLLKQVKAFPQNLSKCFMTIAETTGRTPKAVANRWYSHLQKDSTAKAFLSISCPGNYNAYDRKSFWSKLLINLFKIKL